MEFKYKRTVVLTLESNHPQRLNRIAHSLFSTKDKEEDPNKRVSINAIME